MKALTKKIISTLLIAVSILSLIEIKPITVEAATKPKTEITKDSLSDEWISYSLHETVSYKCMDYDLPRYKDNDWIYEASRVVFENKKDAYLKFTDPRWIKKMAEKCKIDDVDLFFNWNKDVQTHDFGKVVYDEEYYNKATSTEKLKPINFKLKMAMKGYKLWILKQFPGYKIDNDNDSTNNGKGKIATIYKGYTSSVLGSERKAGDVFDRNVWYSVKFTEDGKLVNEELVAFIVTIEIVDKLTSENKTWYQNSLTETISEKWQEMFSDSFLYTYVLPYVNRSKKEKNRKNWFDGEKFEKEAAKLYANKVEFDPVEEAKNFPDWDKRSNPKKLMDELLYFCAKNGPCRKGTSKIYMVDMGTTIIDRKAFDMRGECSSNLFDDVKRFALQEEFYKDICKKYPKYRQVTQEERVDFILNNKSYKGKVIDFTDITGTGFAPIDIKSGDTYTGYRAFSAVLYDGKKRVNEFIFIVKTNNIFE